MIAKSQTENLVEITKMKINRPHGAKEINMERTVYRLRAMDKDDFFGKTATIHDYATRSEAIEAMNKLKGKTGAIHKLYVGEDGEILCSETPFSF